jgi:hypothetical protein
MLFPLPEREIDKEDARRAEELVSNHEREELRRLGRPDTTSTLFSFIRIEVKSVKARRLRNFILTSSEWEAARKFGRDYRVCVVLRPRNKVPEILPQVAHIN